MKRSPESHRRKILAFTLHSRTRRYYVSQCDIPVISFDELGVPFQAPIAMDLRNAGICTLSNDNKGRPGLWMREIYVAMTHMEFYETIKKMNLI